MSDKAGKVQDKSPKGAKLQEKASKGQQKSPKTQDKEKGSKSQEKSPKKQEKSPKVQEKSTKKQDKSPKAAEKSPTKVRDKSPKGQEKAPKVLGKPPKATKPQEKSAPKADSKSSKSAKSPGFKQTKIHDFLAKSPGDTKNVVAKSKKPLPTATTTSGSSVDSEEGEEWTTGAVGGSAKNRSPSDLLLPQSKIKYIMKSSPEIDQVGTEVLFVLTKATELFMQNLIQTAYETSKDPESVEYKDMANAVEKNSRFAFLQDVIPQKMSAREALAEMAKQKEMEDIELFE